MKNTSCLILTMFIVTSFSSLSSANESYHCLGKYNTGSDYNHIYTVKKNFLGETLFWEGQEFKVHAELRPLRLYATYVGNTGVDVLFIDNQTLKVEFSSIRYGTPFFAKGTCKKID